MLKKTPTNEKAQRGDTGPKFRKGDCKPTVHEGSPHSTNTTPSGSKHQSVLQARLEYADRGWETFPAPADGSKKSLKSAEHSNGAAWGATKDPAVIQKEFTQRRFKNQNVGIPTGEENGFIVIEADTDEHGENINGEAVLQAQAAEHGPLPDTLMSRSPSGSRHRYFKHPGKGIRVKSFAHIFGPGSGVDCKGDGGMVLGPPSFRPPKPGKASGHYEWINPGTEIAAAPLWLLDIVVEKLFAAPVKARFNNYPPVTMEECLKALAVLDPDCDEWTWTKIARGMGHGLGEEGWPPFHEWSKDGDKYKGERDCRKKWDHAQKSLSQITVGTLFKLASIADPAWRGEPDIIDVDEKLTELGNAKRLVRLHGENLRFVHAWGSWMIWRDGQWRKDGDGGIMRLAAATVEAMFEEASKVNDPNRRSALLKHALESQKANRLRHMVELAESDARTVLSPSMWDAHNMLLGTKNGVIDLRTGAFREAQRDDYVTKQAGTSYDASARCPNWEAFLLKFFVDKELIAYVQRACGYILTGLTGEEVMFFLWGSGANGKSTFRETLFALMGDYAIGADAGLLITRKNQGAATPDLVRLHGARLVTVNETEEKDHLNESRVKFITSHDTITARNLYKEPFDFTPTHKAVVTTNHRPIVRGTDEGIWRRIHLWPFTVRISNTDKVQNFREEKLLPELPGILNWALKGLKEYRRMGLKPPSCVTAATDEYRQDMDLIGQWIEERCTLDKAAKYRSSYLYADYEQWSEQEVGFKISAVAFGRALSERGFEKIKKMQDGGRGFAGLQLRSLSNSRKA